MVVKIDGGLVARNQAKRGHLDRSPSQQRDCRASGKNLTPKQRGRWLIKWQREGEADSPWPEDSYPSADEDEPPLLTESDSDDDYNDIEEVSDEEDEGPIYRPRLEVSHSTCKPRKRGPEDPDAGPESEESEDGTETRDEEDDKNLVELKEKWPEEREEEAKDKGLHTLISNTVSALKPRLQKAAGWKTDTVLLQAVRMGEIIQTRLPTS